MKQRRRTRLRRAKSMGSMSAVEEYVKEARSRDYYDGPGGSIEAFLKAGYSRVRDGGRPSDKRAYRG